MQRIDGTSTFQQFETPLPVSGLAGLQTDAGENVDTIRGACQRPPGNIMKQCMLATRRMAQR